MRLNKKKIDIFIIILETLKLSFSLLITFNRLILKNTEAIIENDNERVI